ncbi:MAG: signal peptidase II [Nanoarchaeota archaeon]
MVDLNKYKPQLFFWSVCISVVLLDQVTKYLVFNYKPELDFRWFMINLVQNTGAGFGILKDQIHLLTLISLVVALLIILFYRKIPKKIVPQLFSALFLGGVAGNLIDRLFRRFVIDFIDFKIWPAFNLADAAISIAVIGLILYFWKK